METGGFNFEAVPIPNGEVHKKKKTVQDVDYSGTTNIAYQNATCAFTIVDSRLTDEKDHEATLDRPHKYMELEDILPNIVATKCGSGLVCTQLEKEIRRMVKDGGDISIGALSNFAYKYLWTRANAPQVNAEDKERIRRTSTIMATVDTEGPKIFLVNAKNAGPIQCRPEEYVTCGSGGKYAKRMLQYSTFQTMTDAECITLGRNAMSYSNQRDPHTGGITRGCHIHQDGSVHISYSDPLRDYFENFEVIKRLEDKIYIQEAGYLNENPENYSNPTLLILHHKYQTLTHEEMIDYIRSEADADTRSVYSWGILGKTSLELISVTFLGSSACASQNADKLFEAARAAREVYEASALNHTDRRQVSKPKHPMNPHFNMQWLYHKPTKQYILVGRAADAALRERLLAKLN